MPRRFGMGLVAVGLVGAVGQSVLPAAGSRVSFVMVGQGDCTVIQEGRFVAVVDTGGKVEGRDVGGRLALPYLRRAGVQKIDLLVLTHPDMDHVGGLGAFLRRYRVGRVAMPGRFASDLVMRSQLRAAGVPPQNVVWLGREASMQVGTLILKLLPPPFGQDYPENDGSMIVTATWPSASFVLTGDAGSAPEQWLVDEGQGRASVLKAGHHGSRSSSSEPFLSAVAPDWSVVSCGRTNRYGHPHPEVLDQLVKYSGNVARTDRDGDVVFEVLPSGFEVSRQRR